MTGLETKLRAQIKALRESLQWMIDNDETNEGDTPLANYEGRTWNDINSPWIEGLNKARAIMEATKDS